MSKLQVNRIFDSQIERKDWKSIIYKELFNLTFDFTLDDWRNIRTKEYWETVDQLDYYGKKLHTLICVKKYIDESKV
jgi:hypothetical protein